MNTNSVCEFVTTHWTLPHRQLHYSAFAWLKNNVPKLKTEASVHIKTAATKATSVLLTLDHPRLLKTDGESVQIFLEKYDQYSNEVVALEKHPQTESATSETVNSVSIKIYVETEYLESSIALDFIFDSKSYKDLTDQQVRDFLETRLFELREAVNLERFDEIVHRELQKKNMKNTSGTARMQALFVDYHTLLSRNRVK